MDAKSKTMGTRTRASRGEILDLLKKQGYRCAVTGQQLTPSDSQLDHIVPVSAGGSNTIDNLQIVTSHINKMKGSMNNDEFIATCKMVAAWNN